MGRSPTKVKKLLPLSESGKTKKGKAPIFIFYIFLCGEFYVKNKGEGMERG